MGGSMVGRKAAQRFDNKSSYFDMRQTLDEVTALVDVEEKPGQLHKCKWLWSDWQARAFEALRTTLYR